MNKYSTQHHRKAPDEDVIPSWIPARELTLEDLQEFAILDSHTELVRKELECILDAHVAAYRADAAGTPRGLCSKFQAAKLNDAQLACVTTHEARCPSVVFVAYGRPLRRR